MSGRLFGQALQADMPGHVAKLILLKLTDAAEPDGSRIFPGIDSIARVAQCSQRHAKRIVGTFREVGLLVMVREGGSGPGDTTEYRLDMTLFRRICDEGWAGVFGPDKGDTMESPLEADKGDTIESPLDPAGTAEKGDTMSPLKKGDISDKGDIGSAKGDSIESPNPSIDPSKEERERDAREDRFAERWRKLTLGYPDCAADDLDAARMLLHAMAEPDQEAATGEGLLDFAAWLKGQRRRPPLQDYLRGKRWTMVPKRPPGAGGGGPPVVDGRCMVEAFSRAWWWLWHRLAERLATAPTAERGALIRELDKHASLAKGAMSGTPIGWPVPAEAWDAIAAKAAQGLTQVPRDGPEAAALGAHYLRLGLTMPIPDVAQWIFVPQEAADGGAATGNETMALSAEDRRFLEEDA